MPIHVPWWQEHRWVDGLCLWWGMWRTYETVCLTENFLWKRATKVPWSLSPWVHKNPLLPIIGKLLPIDANSKGLSWYTWNSGGNICLQDVQVSPTVVQAQGHLCFGDLDVSEQGGTEGSWNTVTFYLKKYKGTFTPLSSEALSSY